MVNVNNFIIEIHYNDLYMKFMSSYIRFPMLNVRYTHVIREISIHT